MQRGELVVEQVFVLGAGLVGGDDGELRGLQRGGDSALPCAAFGQRQRLTGHQFMQGGRLAGRRVAERLQQAGCIWAEQLPLFCIVTGLADLAAQRKPLLGAGAQALVGRAVGFVTGVRGLIGLPRVEAGLDVALEDLGQVVVAVKSFSLAMPAKVSTASSTAMGQAPAAGLHNAART